MPHTRECLHVLLAVPSFWSSRVKLLAARGWPQENRIFAFYDGYVVQAFYHSYFFIQTKSELLMRFIYLNLFRFHMLFIEIKLVIDSH